jgi:site-specific recombinase XerD
VADLLPVLIPEVDPDLIDADGLPEISPELADDLAYGADLVRGRRAKSTVRAYDSDLRVLFAYLHDRGQPDTLPVEPLLVVAFIASEARPDTRDGHRRPARAVSTIERRLAAIGKAHQLSGLEDPTKDQRVRDALTGARRKLGIAPTNAKAPLELEALDHMLRRIPISTHAGRRDRALLLVGIACTVRRSELVALDREDIEFVPEGMLVSIRRSKGDQEGEGETLAIAYGDRVDLCAVRALQTWLAGASIHTEAIFRRVRAGDQLTTERLGDRSVALIVKKHAAPVGLDTSILAGHSLRIGGITAAAQDGNDERALARLSRHKDLGVLRGYIRRANAFEDAAQVLTSTRGR